MSILKNYKYDKPGAWLILSLLLLASVTLIHCNHSRLDFLSDADDSTLYLGLMLAWWLSDPCNTIHSPDENWARPTQSNSGSSMIHGRIETAAGQPVVNALVVAERTDAIGEFFVSSHSSINRNGSFIIAGVFPGNYRLSVEPVSGYQAPASQNYTEFAGRIDQHMDCFLNPEDFSPGWFRQPESTITSIDANASSIPVGSTDVDLGVLYID